LSEVIVENSFVIFVTDIYCHLWWFRA